ncbi:MAG: COG1615 family transporter, partial [bacterium]|nr:COG1615 family transporter [bacterium]
MNLKRSTILLGILAILVITMVGIIISVYPNWLWFGNLQLAPVFWTMALGKYGVAAVLWFLIIVTLAVNLYAAQRLHKPGEQKITEIAGMPVSGKSLNTLILAAILIVSFVIASKGSVQWNMVLSYLKQQPFGSTDPIFGKDIGFYVFSLPFYLFVREQLLIILLFAALVTVIWYVKDGGVQIIGELVVAEDRPTSLPKVNVADNVGKHLLVLAGILVLLAAWGYQLKAYGVLYSTQGPAFGASYTDVNIKVIVYRLLTLLSFLMCLFIIYNAFRLKIKLLLISTGIWVGAIVIFATGLPVLVQQFVVKPNELAKESPYIAHNIDFTRRAYNLNNIKEVDFEVNNDLTAEDIQNHDVTIQNIRVWDERPLLQTYRQIQSIRLYYDFNNVDVDRYRIDNQYRQVMLAARELVVDQLPPQAQTWVNRHLIYTHGYGLAMSPVNEVTAEGLPQLMIKDVPPA